MPTEPKLSTTATHTVQGFTPKPDLFESALLGLPVCHLKLPEASMASNFPCDDFDLMALSLTPGSLLRVEIPSRAIEWGRNLGRVGCYPVGSVVELSRPPTESIGPPSTEQQVPFAESAGSLRLAARSDFSRLAEFLAFACRHDCLGLDPDLAPQMTSDRCVLALEVAVRSGYFLYVYEEPGAMSMIAGVLCREASTPQTMAIQRVVLADPILDVGRSRNVLFAVLDRCRNRGYQWATLETSPHQVGLIRAAYDLEFTARGCWLVYNFHPGPRSTVR